jgi:hypothetical protein
MTVISDYFNITARGLPCVEDEGTHWHRYGCAQPLGAFDEIHTAPSGV